MKLPDLRFREKPPGGREARRAAQLTSQDRTERFLAEGFRALSRLCARAAELIESQRLRRRGFEPQGTWLERLDGGGSSARRR